MSEAPKNQPAVYGGPEETMTKGEIAALVAVGVTVVGSFVGLFIFAAKQEQKELAEEQARLEAMEARQREFEDWITEEENNGNNVYELADGRYLTVPREAAQAKYNKRP
jgi:hypothetical protein